MASKFIEITVQNYNIVHGFDKENKEIEEYIEVNKPSIKLVNVDRILSVSEKFVLISYGFDRIIYWEYLDGYDVLTQKLLSL